MNKANYFLPFFLILTLASCVDTYKGEKQVTGNWKNKDNYLSINDSMIISSIYRKFEQFSRSGDTLITNQYKIYDRKVSNDSLSFTLLRDDFPPEYFQMKGMAEFENGQPDRIVFSSMGCYGECPLFNFEISRTGVCFFQGIDFTDSIGNYRAQDGNRIFTLLVDKVNTIDLKSLDTLYSFHGADGPFVSLDVFINEKKYSTSVYGNRVEPRELRMVIDCIMSVYKDIKWVKTEKTHIYTTSKPLPVERVIKIKNEP